MKKILLVLVLLLSVSLIGCTSADNLGQMKKEEQQKEETQQIANSDEELVTDLVEGFSGKLQMVSLLAPEDILIKSMQENYGDFVTQKLIEKWASDPVNAPGRLTSSPWPDRIEILSMERLSQNSFEVKGVIIEITMSEGVAAKRPIVLTVKKINGKWLIEDATLGGYEENSSINYENTEYGFSFSLPQGWEGYTIVTDNWEGISLKDASSEKVIEQGPIISIRHPDWTAENQRQDIPIMVFTIEQWDSLQKGAFHIGAAPIGPRELGYNDKYVFALPARYNYAFPAGYEEVENILKNDPLKVTAVSKPDKAKPSGQGSIKPSDGSVSPMPLKLNDDLQLGKLKVDMRKQSIDEIMKADLARTVDDSTAGINSETLYYDDKTQIQLVEGKVYSITVFKNDYPTPRGLKIGDSADKLKLLYGEPSHIEDDTWTYSSTGGYDLLFVTVKYGKVASIKVSLVM